MWKVRTDGTKGVTAGVIVRKIGSSGAAYEVRLDTGEHAICVAAMLRSA